MAVAAGMIEPPLATFIAVIPLMKLLNRPGASLPQRFVGPVLDRAAKPVGGSAEATIELASPDEGSSPRRAPAPPPTEGTVEARPSLWREARLLADRAHAKG